MNNNAVDSSSGRLYKTAIDNIRLSVGGKSTTTLPTANSGDGETSVSRRQIPGIRSSSSETGHIHSSGGESANSGACQLDDLISSLMEMSVDVEGTQRQQPPSLRHGVVFTAHY